MKRIDQATLARLQALKAVDVLGSVADFAKEDPTFIPVQDPTTTRWHVTAVGGEFELLLTGSKFWDTRAQVGGGGGVDLVMHLTRTNFRGAVSELLRRGL